MGKVFKGQVKVQDVKDEFERLVNNINAVIDQYNEALDTISSDLYGEGSSNLAAPGYTLSIGGLKVLMNAYRGCTIGSKVYKVNDTTAVITRGIYFSEDGESVINLPQNTVAINKNTRYVYYDKTTNNYTTTPNSNTVLVSRINANRNSKLISTYPFDAEGLGMSIRCGSNNVNPKTWQAPNNSSVGCFVRAWQPPLDQSASDGKFYSDRMYFNGAQIAFTRTRGYRQFNYFVWAPLLYLPKGIPSPFYHRMYYQDGQIAEGGVPTAPCSATITRK